MGTIPSGCRLFGMARPIIYRIKVPAYLNNDLKSDRTSFPKSSLKTNRLSFLSLHLEEEMARTEVSRRFLWFQSSTRKQSTKKAQARTLRCKIFSSAVLVLELLF